MGGDRVRPLSWRTRWRVYEYLRNSLWVVPFLFVVVAITLGYVFPYIDQHTTATIGIIFGADAARSVLGAIAGGMITFTGFVFSILLLAVQFGSSQFSPRMLRRFLRDPSTKAALGMFMATFVYALMVLRVVGTGTNQGFVPSNSIALALFLLLLSMLMFLRLITRTTQGLRVAAVLRDLGRDARRVIDRTYPDLFADDEGAGRGAAAPAGDGGQATGRRGGAGAATGSRGDGRGRASGDGDGRAALVEAGGAPLVPPDVGQPGRTVTYRGRPGVLQSVDAKSLAEHARRADTVIDLVPRFGDLLAEGAPLFRLPAGADTIEDRWLRDAVATGDERNMRQDPAFAFRLFADISAKALSPGVNDPTTSVQALDQIELLLRQLGGRRLSPGVGRDREGVVRFRYQVPTWEDFLTLAIDETRHYGEGSVQVMRRLRALLGNLRDVVPSPRRAAVDRELALLDSAASRVFADEVDRAVAGASDRQGLGATDMSRGAPPASAGPRPA